MVITIEGVLDVHQEEGHPEEDHLQKNHQEGSHLEESHLEEGIHVVNLIFIYSIT